MKINIQVLAFLTTIAFVSTSATLHAQHNAIKYAMSGKGRYLMEYERAVNEKTTILAGFQKWNLNKTNNTTVPLYGIIASDKTVTKINGRRFEFLARHFSKKAFNGGFFEGGFYVGKHDISIEKTATTTNVLTILLFNFNEITTSSTSNKQYKAVRVAGAKIGGGFQKTISGFNIELSGGLNFNAFNAQNQRPILALKHASPYARLAFGVAF